MPRSTCYMDLRTTPPFRHALDKYNFLMNATNPLNETGVVMKLPTDAYAVGN